jgi:predicted DCC family thiol-disulfide oxidoreductase YuxK
VNVKETPMLEVWMDGNCRLCQTSRTWCELRDRNARIRFVDFRNTRDEDLPLPRGDHEESMWVRDDDGDLLAGFAAWRRVMSELPGWRLLAWLTAIPPFNLIGPPLYRLIAAHRSRLRASPTAHHPGAGTPRSTSASKRGQAVQR